MSNYDEILTKADNIADITDISDLDCVLIYLTNGKYTFNYKNGFIYADEKYTDQDSVLCYLRLDEIQAVYDINKRCIKKGENYENYCSVTFPGTVIAGANYLMVGGHFKLISLGESLYEQEDLLIVNRKNCVTVHSYGSYFNVPKILQDFEKSYELVNPIANIHKFKKITYYHITKDRMYIMIRNKLRYIADPFDFELSYPCADTYDLINIVTGQRTPTWPLTKFALGDDVCTFLQQHTSIENPHPELQCIYYDEKWDTYHLASNPANVHSFIKISIIKLNKIGKITKAAAAASE